MQLNVKKVFFRLLLIAVILLFYFWTTTGGYNYFDFRVNYQSYYNDLAQSFLAGKLNLLYEPRPELLALRNPYDPSINGPYRVHDASLYKGKYYLYFGPTPVLAIYMPYRLILHHGTHDNFALFIFSVGTLIWGILLLFYLKKKYFNNIPEWMVLLTISVLGFANATPILMRRPAIYEVAISSGLFFLMGAIYLFTTAFSKEKPSKSKLFLGSLFLGLAVGARPQIGLSCVLFPFIWFRVLKKISPKHWITALPSILVSFLPFVLCIIGLLVYNYLRFDNILEFGTKYQLAGKLTNAYNLFDVSRIPVNLYLNIFQPPFIDSYFPFAHLKVSVPAFISYPPYYDNGPIAGVIPGIPFINLIFLFFFVLIVNRIFNKNCLSGCNPFPYYEFFLLLFSALLNIGVLLLMPGTVMRYTADYANYLIFLAVIVWFYFYSNSMYGYSSKLLLDTITVLTSLISNVIYRISFCLESQENMPRKQEAVVKEYRKDTALLKSNLSELLSFNKRSSRREKSHFLTGKLIFNIIAILVSIYSIFLGVAFSIEAPEASLKGQNSLAYDQLISWLKPILPLESKWDFIREKMPHSTFTVACDNIFGPQYDIHNIADGRLDTEWAPVGSKPVRVIITPTVPSRIGSLGLVSRDTYLYESWEKLIAILYNDNTVVSVQTFEFPNAYKQRTQTAVFQPVLADKIELLFADPVTRDKKGKELDPAKLYPGFPADFCPGYSEIAIKWL